MRFGTELELFHNDYCASDECHTPENVSGFFQFLRSHWSPANGEALVNRGGYCPSRNNAAWELKTDSSAGFELASPADVGPAALWRLYLDLKALHKLESRGLSVDASCGQHVHVEARTLRPRHIRRLAQLWARVEPALLWAVPESRRSNRFCRRIDDRTKAEAWRAPFSVARWREFCRNSNRNALNLLPWLSRGTIEIRLPAGTLKPFQACTWALVACALVRRAAEGRGDFARPAASPDAFSAAVAGMVDVTESLARLRSYWARPEFNGPGAASGRRLAQALEWHFAGRLAFHLPPDALCSSEWTTMPEPEPAPEPEPEPEAVPVPAPAAGPEMSPGDSLIAGLPPALRALVEFRDHGWHLTAAGQEEATAREFIGCPGRLTDLRAALGDDGGCGCADCAEGTLSNRVNSRLARVTA